MAATSSASRGAGAWRVGEVRRALEQAAAAIVAEREDDARAGAEGELGGPGEILRRADEHRRLGIAEEVADLVALVGGVERQVHEAGAQHGEVEEQRLDRLLGLHGDPARRRQVERIEQVGEHRARPLDVAPGVEAAARRRSRWRRRRGRRGSRRAGRRTGWRVAAAEVISECGDGIRETILAAFAGPSIRPIAEPRPGGRLARAALTG